MLILGAALRHKIKHCNICRLFCADDIREESIAGPYADDTKQSALGEEAPETYKEAEGSRVARVDDQ